MDALIPQKSPYAKEVEAGKSYYWCSCGRSKAQPFCDGSHKDTGMSPVPFEVEESKKVWLCGCKHAKTQPFCDGTHSKL